MVGMFLLVSFNTISITGTTSKIKKENYQDLTPVMWADNRFLDRYEADYNSEETAFIDPILANQIQATNDYSILDLLYYIPEERTQGGCANCWMWPSTSIVEIALRVQLGVMENRLSVQYMNTCGELYPSTDIECCGGGTLSMLAAFYRLTGIVVPWSNENAYWQDYVLIGQCFQVECDEIAKDPNYPISSIKSNVIKTRGVSEETAIDNIKNILHQNRGVYFSIMYPDLTDLHNFQDFWRNGNEEDIYDLDYYAGHPWVDDEAVGHALLIVGYHDDENTDDTDYWILLNSWGTRDGRPNGLMRIDMHMNYSLKYSNYYAFGAETLNVTFGGAAPTTSISGPTSGRVNKDYIFDVSAVDPQGDDVYLYVKWGDGTNTTWLGPYDSGEVMQVSHSFSERRNYTIKANAKDIYDNEGKDQPLLITMSFWYRPIFQFLKWLFEQLFPNTFLLKQHSEYFTSYIQKMSSKSSVNFDDYIVFDDENDDVRAFFVLKGPFVNRLFNHIDLLSFSIYEDAETPEFLYMKMHIGEVKYTELRSLYNIIWDFNGLMYCTGMHTLNSSETILDYSAYYETDRTEHKIWNTSVEIDEVNGVFTWTITKNDLGLKAGDVLEKPWAQAVFGTKRWETFKRFSMDEIPSGSDYVIQY